MKRRCGHLGKDSVCSATTGPAPSMAERHNFNGDTWCGFICTAAMMVEAQSACSAYVESQQPTLEDPPSQPSGLIPG